MGARVTSHRGGEEEEAERTDDGDGLGRLERERAADVLEQDGARRADLAHDLEVVFLDVNVLICGRIKREEGVEADCAAVNMGSR